MACLADSRLFLNILIKKAKEKKVGTDIFEVRKKGCAFCFFLTQRSVFFCKMCINRSLILLYMSLFACFFAQREGEKAKKKKKSARSA